MNLLSGSFGGVMVTLPPAPMVLLPPIDMPPVPMPPAPPIWLLIPPLLDALPLPAPSPPLELAPPFAPEPDAVVVCELHAELAAPSSASEVTNHEVTEPCTRRNKRDLRRYRAARIGRSYEVVSFVSIRR
jgi:hypothetical protein